MSEADATVAIRRSGAFARLLLGVMLLLGLVSLFADVNFARFIQDIDAGREYSTADMARASRWVQAVGRAWLLGFVVTAVVFLRWFFLCYRETGRLTPGGLNHGPGWAIGAWFVPILNLVRPYSIMKEIVVRNSPPGASHSLVSWWWGALLASSFLDRLGVSWVEAMRESSGLQSAMDAVIAANVLNLIAAVLAIRLVGKVTALLVDSATTPQSAEGRHSLGWG